MSTNAVACVIYGFVVAWLVSTVVGILYPHKLVQNFPQLFKVFGVSEENLNAKHLRWVRRLCYFYLAVGVFTACCILTGVAQF